MVKIYFVIQITKGKKARRSFYAGPPIYWVLLKDLTRLRYYNKRVRYVTYTAKSAAAVVEPPNFSPSSNFWTLLRPAAMPLEPLVSYGYNVIEARP